MAQTRGEQRPGPLAREGLDLFEEYQRTGDQSLLTRAIPVLRAALAAAARTGVPDIAAYHNNLAYALHNLADATADTAAQAESVSHQRAAVAATDPGDPDRAPYLFTLASGLRDLHGRTRRVELLHEAVQAATEAIDLHGFEPALTTQYSIQVRQEALAATPPGHTSRIDRLVNLAASVSSLAERTDSLDAALEAARYLEEALDALPEGHPGRAVCLADLAEAYHANNAKRRRASGSGVSSMNAEKNPSLTLSAGFSACASRCSNSPVSRARSFFATGSGPPSGVSSRSWSMTA
jgi:hypothetical protein